MVKVVIHYHWQSVTASTQSSETISGLQAGLSPCPQSITLVKAHLTPPAPWKTTKEHLSLFLYSLVTEPQILISSPTVLYWVLHTIADVRWYVDILVSGVVVDATLTLVSSKPPVMNSSPYVREGTFLILGAGWRGRLFFLSLFSFNVFLHCFFLSFKTLPIMLQSFVSPAWLNGRMFNLPVRICIQLGDKKLCTYVAMAVGFLNISYWKPSWVLCTVKQ